MHLTFTELVIEQNRCVVKTAFYLEREHILHQTLKLSKSMNGTEHDVPMSTITTDLQRLGSIC